MDYFKQLYVSLIGDLGSSAFPLLLWVIIKFVTKWILFKDAGEKKWKALIPYYNTYVQFNLVWKPKWFFMCVGGMVPLAIFNKLGLTEGFWSAISSLIVLFCFVIDILGQYKVGRAFGKGKLFSVCLGLFNPIFVVLLAFTDHHYMGPYLTGEQDREAFQKAVDERVKEWGIEEEIAANEAKKAARKENASNKKTGAKKVSVKAEASTKSQKASSKKNTAKATTADTKPKEDSILAEEEPTEEYSVLD